MIVVDASALAVAVLDRSGDGDALRRRLVTEVCHAPHLIDAELGNLLRRRVLRGELDARMAAILLAASPALIDHRHDMTGALACAAWALRDNVSFYDALYAALAQALGASLVTGDERLRHAPGLPCATESAT